MSDTTTIERPSRHAGAGVIHRWRQTLIPTAREAPADATAVSHILLVRAGYIRQVGAGIYNYLPLAFRSLKKISDIVREEMDAAGASELLLPALTPIELFSETGRAEDYGDLLFTSEDRHGRTAALGPTHEEVITSLMRGAVTSYKQLPLSLYQVQSKFRDEFRPRSGLLRGREFIMKDAYSFHLTLDGDGGLNETYDRMYSAYSNIFERCGLDFSIVEAEAGPIGGSASHEFMVNCAAGEDTIMKCPETGYAANVEKCEIGERAWSFDRDAGEPLTKVHTPKMPGIDAVAEHLRISPSAMLKTIVFDVTDAPEGEDIEYVLAVVRGDHEVNEGKVRDLSGLNVALADDKKARAAGFAIGYVSPAVATGSGGADALCKTRVVIDADVAKGETAWATGADEPDHHVTGFNWRREMGAMLDDATRVRVGDIRNAMSGDPSPRATGAALFEGRGIEVGHIFKLGSKYSEAMGFDVMDAAQKRQVVIMGCYGIGVSRTLQACVEMSHDDNGIVWPWAIAPYHVEIVVMKPDDEAQAELAQRLAGELSAAGMDVLVDDRKERPGVKFKDADLIGLPVRVTIGDKAMAEDSVELKRRTDEGKGGLVPIADVVNACRPS